MATGQAAAAGADMTPTPPADLLAAALVGLPGMTPGRLRVVLAHSGDDPEAAWGLVCRGRVRLPGASRADDPRAAARRAELVRTWAAAGAGCDLAGLSRACRRAGVVVMTRASSGYPGRLRGDPHAPAVLFVVGRPEILDRPTVAIVGTRRCTGYGRDVAASLGRDLADAGVVVVSGLAAGIDGAAQRAVALVDPARLVGVSGSGVDVVYPRSSADLWSAARAGGLLISEAPMGASPDAWRFPARNRVIASLSDVVVVVESHRQGGSLHTVDAATARGRTVMAVPGPVTSPASEGTNSLLADGCAVVRDARDVLAALALSSGSCSGAGLGSSPAPPQLEASGPSASQRASVTDVTMVAVLAAVDATPTGLGTVLERTGLAVPAAALALDRLCEGGWLRAGSGWWESIGVPGRPL